MRLRLTLDPLNHATKILMAVAATSLGCVAYAGSMSHADYAAKKDQISADYKADKAACDKLAGNEKDVCIEKAKGKEKVAKAELEYNYTGKKSDADKIAVEKADASYAVAKEMCDDRQGRDKDACVAQAKAAHTKAMADAKMHKKVGDAQRS